MTHARVPNRTGQKILTTPTGLSIPDEATFEAWVRAGRQIARISSASAWYLGDWLVHGEDRYADRYRRVIDAVGLDYKTLRNYAWVARGIDRSRRREHLSFQHHAEVASLSPEAQDEWLAAAQRHGWSRNRLRQELRQLRGGNTTTDRAVLPRLQVRVTDVDRWRRAAEEADVDFERWIVATLDDAAESALTARPRADR